MSDRWSKVPFEEAIDFKEGPGILARDFRETGVPLIRLAGVKTGADILAGCNFLDAEMVEKKWSHFRLSKGDVLLSTSASLGEVAIVPAAGVGAIPYTGLIRMRGKAGSVDQDFLPWLLRAPDFARQVQMMGVGSVMNHFGPSHLRQMSVTIPPLDDQRRIAGVLGALDNLIEMNRNLATACDALAEALWSRAVAGVGPTHKLSDHASVVLGGTPSRARSEYWGGDVPWLNSGKANEFRVIAPSEHITALGRDKSSTKLMRAGTTIVAITGATLGQVSRLEIDACGNQSLVGIYSDVPAARDFLYYAVRDQIDVLLAALLVARSNTSTRATSRSCCSGGSLGLRCRHGIGAQSRC